MKRIIDPAIRCNADALLASHFNVGGVLVTTFSYARALELVQEQPPKPEPEVDAQELF